MLKSLSAYVSLLLGLMALSLVLGGLGLLFALLNGVLLTHLTWVSGSAYLSAFISFVLFTLATMVLTCYNERLLASFNAKWIMQQLTHACHHCLHLPAESLSAYPAGELAKYFSHYEFGLKQGVQSAFSMLIALISLFGLLVYFAYQLPWLMLPVFLLILFSFSYKIILLKWQCRVSKNQLETQTAFSRWLSELMLNINKCRQAYALPHIIKQGLFYLKKLKQCTSQFMNIQMALTTGDALLLLILTLLIYAQMSLALLPLLLMVTQFTGMLDRLSASWLQWAQAKESVSAITPLLNQIPPSTTAKIKTIPDAINLVFDNVSYRHLKNISFHLNSSEFMAITGPSGIGKSTILRLLLGLITPTSGRILINDLDLHHYDLTIWRQSLGVVLQNTQLLNANLYTNIAGTSGASLDQAWACADALGLGDDIRRMPMGMFTRISDQAGESLSGGQRQKVLLARALIKQPKCLLLDEATSAMDNVSQAKIQAYLAEQGVMRLVVAHRLSSIAEADVIYELNVGSGLRVIRDSRAPSSYSIPPGQNVLN